MIFIFLGHIQTIFLNEKNLLLNVSGNHFVKQVNLFKRFVCRSSNSYVRPSTGLSRRKRACAITTSGEQNNFDIRYIFVEVFRCGVTGV